MGIESSGRAPRRGLIRLKDRDDVQVAAYFITIATHGGHHMFGTVVDGEVRLSAFGEIVRDEWARSAETRREIKLDAFVVMPNHIHGIVAVAGDVAAATRTGIERGPELRVPGVVGSFIRALKSGASKRINVLRGSSMSPVWEPGYHQHIIRDENDLAIIREYVVTNPARWAEDRYYSTGR